MTYRAVGMAMILLATASLSALAESNTQVKVKPDRLVIIGGEAAWSIKPNMKLAPLWESALTNAGWAGYEVVDWDTLTAAQLRRARVVVVAQPPRRSVVSAWDEAVLDLLTDYVKAGGGLMLSQTTSQMTVLESVLTDALARRFGTRLLIEDFAFDPGVLKTVGEWGERVAYTEQVTGPVAEGVKGLYYPATFVFLVMHSMLTFLPEAPWQVVLKAGPGVRTIPRRLGLDDFDRDVRPAGFDRDVPLAGVREFGQGRVAYMGIQGPQLFSRGHTGWDRKIFESYMVNGFDGRPSGLMTLMLNTFAWLSANADRLEGATLTKRETPPDERSSAWKSFKGVVGARTVYSTGASTPDEYVAKARAMGLDYIIFLEDFAALKAIGYKHLQADCRRLTYKDFLAIPGITYLNTDGNHQYVYGPDLRLPSELLTDETGKRMRVYGDVNGRPYTEIYWLYTLLGFENNGGWFNFCRNPYPSYDMRDFANMGVVAQENGKTIDTALDGYALDIRNGQGLLPQAITLLKSAAELEGCTNGTTFLNVIGAAGRKELDTYLTGMAGHGGSHLYPEQPPYGNTYITTGPTIDLTMPRADTDAEGDLYNKALQEWPLSLKVTSSVGLKDVLIMDGDRMIRRFQPNGATSFAFTNTIGKERQKYIWVRVTDKRGGEAIGRSINCNSWLLREFQCNDRNNQLLESRQKRPDGSLFYGNFAGGTTTPNKGPWNGGMGPVGYFVSDEKLGAPSSIYDGSPENHPGCSWSPWVAYDGQIPAGVGMYHLVAGREGAPHVKAYRVVASSDVLVGDRILDGVFPCDSNLVGNVWGTMYPVKPSTFLKMTARTTLYLIKPDGISASLWEQDFEFLKDIPVPTNKPRFLSLGHFGSGGSATEMLYAQKGKAVDLAPVKGVPLRFLPFDVGDYAGLIKSPFGSLAVYSLTDGLTLGCDNVNASVYISATGGVVKAGTKYRVRMLAVGMNRLVQDPAALAAAIQNQYGLGVPATGYTVQADQGAVTDQAYVLKLAAMDGCFRGTVNGVKTMAGNLGCQVTGLNDRWTAVFQWQGKTPKMRLIPVEAGKGYAVLRDDDDGVPVFIGHPCVADNPAVVLQFARGKDGRLWQLEIHNPTDRTVKTTVRTASGLEGFRFNERLKLAPGASVFRDVDSRLSGVSDRQEVLTK